MRALSSSLLFVAVLSSIATSTEEDAAWTGETLDERQMIFFDAQAESRGIVRVGLPADRVDEAFMAQVSVSFVAGEPAAFTLTRVGSDVAEYGPQFNGIEEAYFSEDLGATDCEVVGDTCWSEWQLIVDGHGVGMVNATWQLFYDDGTGLSSGLVLEEVE